MEWILQGIRQSCMCAHSTHLRQIAAVLKISLGLIYGIFTLRRLRTQQASQLRQTLIRVPCPILHNLIVFAYVAHIGDEMQTLSDFLIQHRSYGGYILLQHLHAMRFQLLIETFHAGAEALLQLLLAAWTFLQMGSHADAWHKDIAAIGALLEHLAAVYEVFLRVASDKQLLNTCGTPQPHGGDSP